MSTEDSGFIRWKAMYWYRANRRIDSDTVNSPLPFSEDSLDSTDPLNDFLTAATSKLDPPPTLRDIKEILIQSVNGGSKHPIYFGEEWYMELLGGEPKIWVVHIVRKDDDDNDIHNDVQVETPAADLPPILRNNAETPVPDLPPTPRSDVESLDTPVSEYFPPSDDERFDTPVADFFPIPSNEGERLAAPAFDLPLIPRRRPVGRPKKIAAKIGLYINLDNEAEVNQFVNEKFPEFEARFNKDKKTFKRMFHNLKWNWKAEQLREYGILIATALPHDQPWQLTRSIYAHSAQRLVQRFVDRVHPGEKFKITHIRFAAISAEKIQVQLAKRNCMAFAKYVSKCHPGRMARATDWYGPDEI